MRRAAILGAAPLLAAAIAPISAQAQAPAPQALCVTDAEAQRALSVEIVLQTPSAICAPQDQQLEIRNLTAAPLGDVRLEISPPLGRGKLRFEPLRSEAAVGDAAAREVFFETSADDGDSWTAASLPRGVGGPDDPFRWGVEEAPDLARLDPVGGLADSVSLRWRGALGETYAPDLALDPEFEISARATDACGRVVRTEKRRVSLAVLKPTLRAELTGRNLTRGGRFGQLVPAAPGDKIEWRVEVGNVGEAAALLASLRLDARRRLGETGVAAAPPEPLENLSIALGDLEEPLVGSEAPLGRIRQDGRVAVLLREVAAPSCGRRDVLAKPIWRCAPEDRPEGETAGLAEPPSWTIGTARLTTTAEADLIEVTQSARGVDGRLEPGDVAEIEVRASNGGAPVFDPSLRVELPDGFEFDASAPPRVVDYTGRASTPNVDVGDPASPDFELATSLEPGQPIVLTFRMRRAAASDSKADDLISVLSYRDGCGVEGRTRSTRTRVAVRRAELRAAIEWEGGALVGRSAGGGAVAARKALFDIENLGDETAERLRMNLRLGAGWRTLRDDRCVLLDGPGDPAAIAPRAYACELSGVAAAGASRREGFSLAPIAEGWSQAAAAQAEAAAAGLGPAAPLSVRGEIEAVRQVGDVERVVARTSAASTAVGFSVRQRLLTDAGGVRPDGAEELELGERALVEVEAEWFGVALDGLRDASISQGLPRALAYLTARSGDGDVAAGEPSVTPDGRLRWSLEETSDEGLRYYRRFVGRLEVEAVDAGEPTGIRAETASADAAFTLDGVAYGARAEGDAAALELMSARPIPVSVRRPRIDLSLRIASDARDAEGRALLGVDDVPTPARFAITNIGAGPAYLDWAAISAPPGLRIAPLGEDRIDNDGDGAIDEADESFLASSERRADGGATLSWLAAPGDASALGGAAQRLAPGVTASWMIGLTAGQDQPPGAVYEIALSGRFGSLPFAQTEGGARVVARGRVGAATRAVDGFLTFIDAAEGGAMADFVSDGEIVTHRARATLPAGRVSNFAVLIDLPPAIGPVTAKRFELGPALACEAGAAPETRPGADGAKRLVWLLGVCDVAQGDTDARSVFLDFEAPIVDVAPTAQPAVRRAWRAPELVAWAAYDGLSADGARSRRRDRLGEAQLEISGPLLSTTVLAATPGAAAPAPDAGDTRRVEIALANLGDQPARAVRVELRPAQARGLNCRTLRLRWRGVRGGGRQRARPIDGEDCAVAMTLPSDTFIGAGQAVRLEARYALSEDAPLGERVGAIIRVAPVRGKPAEIEDVRRTATPSAPSARIEAGRNAGESAAGLERQPRVGFGEDVRLVAEVDMPEGAIDADFEVRLRAPREALEGLNASLALQDAGGVYRPRADQELTIEDAPGGWTVYRRRIGADLIGPAGPQSRRRRMRFVLSGRLADAPQLRDGAVIAAEAALLPAGGGPAARALGAAFRVAEPLLEAVAFSETTRGGPGAPIAIGEQGLLRGRVCNRGSGPAYGLQIAGRLPDGFERSLGGSLLIARGTGGGDDQVMMGATEWFGRDFQVSSFPGVALAPGACAELAAPVVLRGDLNALGVGGGVLGGGVDPAGVSGAARGQFVFNVAVARAGRDPRTPGRVYISPARATVRPARESLRITAPGQISARPGEAITAPFIVDAPALQGASQLNAEIIADAGGLDWTLFRDVDADGALGPSDAPLRGGAELPAGGQVALIAQALLPPDVAANWRGSVRLRAIAATTLGAPGEDGLRAGDAAGLGADFRAERAIALAVEPLGGERLAQSVATRRLMAVDRDCDGALNDELALDALFEVVKSASAGECLVVRVLFENAGRTPVNDIVLEETALQQLEILPETLRFGRTPPGLVDGAAELVGRRPEERVVFRYVGALAPGRSGEVGYRARVGG